VASQASVGAEGASSSTDAAPDRNDTISTGPPITTDALSIRKSRVSSRFIAALFYTHGRKLLTACGLIFVCCAPTILLQILYANSFLPITEGWFSEYGRLIRQGMMPYVDFQLCLPPLYPLQIAAFQAAFGESFFRLHIWGIAITCFLGLSLFFLLRQLFHPWIAALAASFGLIYYQSGNAFFGYDFTQFVTLYLLLAGVCLMGYIRNSFSAHDRNDPNNCIIFSLGAGLFMGLAFLIKQSNASVAALVIGLVAAGIAFRLHSWRRAVGHMLAMAAGLALPVGATVLWLVLSGAMGAFIANIFTQAMASKGGVSVILFNWMGRQFIGPGAFLASLAHALELLVRAVAIIVVAGMATRFLMNTVRGVRPVRFRVAENMWARQGRDDAAAMTLAVGGSVFLLAIVMMIYHRSCGACGAFKSLADRVLGMSLIEPVVLYVAGTVAALVLLAVRPSRVAASAAVIFGLGLGLVWGNGTSAGVSEISTFLGLAVLGAFLLQLGAPRVVPALIPLVFALAFAAQLIAAKFETPYHWWHVDVADARHADCASGDGPLRGLCLPQADAGSITRVRDDILANSRPNDPVYVFPHMPLFNLLSQRAPYAGAVVSWFDVMSDQQALSLAGKLRADPPRVIVMAQLPESVFAAHERLFRDGHETGQRAILRAITDLENSHILRRVDQVEISGNAIIVYARN
jgi:hypothetical protein